MTLQTNNIYFNTLVRVVSNGMHGLTAAATETTQKQTHVAETNCI